MKSNEKDKDNVCYAQPKTLEQRVAIANDFTQRFKYSVPFGIDEMNNAANDRLRGLARTPLHHRRARPHLLQRRQRPLQIQSQGSPRLARESLR